MHFARGSCPRSGSGARATAMMSGLGIVGRVYRYLELSEGFTCKKGVYSDRAKSPGPKENPTAQRYRTKVL